MLNIEKIRTDFPFLSQTVHGKRIAFLDTGASAQKPQVVIDAIADANTYNYANIHRGVYSLSDIASERYEKVRDQVQTFIHASSRDEIVFTSGTTESINLVAQSLANSYFKQGDEIIISEMEHHANIVPWQLIAERYQLKLGILPINQNDELDLEILPSLINDKTKLIAVTHCSNVLGTVNPIKKIVDIAHQYQVLVLVDGAQSVVHQAIDVQDLGCDFFVFSAHKLYGPTGVGVLYGRKQLLDQMSPYQGGGDMIDRVSFSGTTFAKAPYKFEAGTPNIVGVIAFGVALDYIQQYNYQDIQVHENRLIEYATMQLNAIKGLQIIGNSTHKAGVITFTIDGFHANDIGTLLDLNGVCVRTGHHCAQPLLEKFGVSSTVRASFGIYNDKDDVDQLVVGLHKAMKMLG